MGKFDIESVSLNTGADLIKKDTKANCKKKEQKELNKLEYASFYDDELYQLVNEFAAEPGRWLCWMDESFKADYQDHFEAFYNPLCLKLDASSINEIKYRNRCLDVYYSPVTKQFIDNVVGHYSATIKMSKDDDIDFDSLKIGDELAVSILNKNSGYAAVKLSNGRRLCTFSIEYPYLIANNHLSITNVKIKDLKIYTKAGKKRVNPLIEIEYELVHYSDSIASPINDKEINYSCEIFNDGTAKIKKYIGHEINVDIISSYEGHIVTCIGKEAFADNKKIESAVIPNSITKIEEDAFFSCKSLQKLILNDGLEIIEESAFSFCNNLKEVILPKSVVAIGNNAFSNCNIDNVIIKNGSTELGRHAFCYPKKATIVNPRTFYDFTLTDYKDIDEIRIPDGIENIKRSSFEHCEYKAVINIPKSIADINAYAFNDCRQLEKIIVEEDNNSFSSRSGVLYDKNKFILIRAPRTIKKFNVPKSITEIGEGSFAMCWNLESITIPKSVKQIKCNAFYWCNNLVNIYYKGSTEEWENIQIEEGNDDLINAAIYYDEKTQ